MELLRTKSGIRYFWEFGVISYAHYTDRIPSGFGGMAFGPLVLLRPKYKDDSGIHAHEQIHVNQWWAWVLVGVIVAFFLKPLGNCYGYYALLAGVGMNAVLYLLVPRYKLWCEVQAYRKQAGYYADDRSWQFAGFIANKYGLNVTQFESHILLKG